MLNVVSTDLVPTNKKYIEITCNKWGNALNYIMGKPDKLAVTTFKYEPINSNMTTYISLYGIASNEEYTSEVSIAYYSTKGFVKANVLPNVPFVANRVTTLSGTLFNTPVSGNYGCNIYLNSEWISGHSIEW